MSLATVTSTVKYAIADRKYLCNNKSEKIYMKHIKNRYNKVRRATAANEIEEALYDIEEDSVGERLLRMAEDCYHGIHYNAYVQEENEESYWDDDDYYDWDDDYDINPITDRLSAWIEFESLTEENEEDTYYEDQENLQFALSGDWQKEVPEEFQAA